LNFDIFLSSNACHTTGMMSTFLSLLDFLDNTYKNTPQQGLPNMLQRKAWIPVGYMTREMPIKQQFAGE
jgi:hypothetical protein